MLARSIDVPLRAKSPAGSGPKSLPQSATTSFPRERKKESSSGHPSHFTERGNHSSETRNTIHNYESVAYESLIINSRSWWKQPPTNLLFFFDLANCCGFFNFRIIDIFSACLKSHDLRRSPFHHSLQWSSFLFFSFLAFIHSLL